MNQSLPSTVPRRPSTGRQVASVIVVATVLTLVWARLGRGVYDDDCLSHYFLAVRAVTEPGLFLDLFARPLFQLVYALPAQLGYGAMEVTTALVTAATLALTGVLAKQVGVMRPWVAVALTAFLPIPWKLSSAALVEPLAGLLLVGATVARLADRPRLTAILVGLLPAARLELVVLAPILLWPALHRHLWTTLGLAAIPLVLWNAGGWITEGDPRWLLHEIQGGALRRSLEGRSLFHYLRAFPVFAGGAVLPLFVAGIIDAVRWTVPGRRLIAILTGTHATLLAFLAWDAHSFGSSNGFLRHLAPVAPFLGILAAEGVDRVMTVRRPDRTVWVAAILGVAWGASIPVFDLIPSFWELPESTRLLPWLWAGSAGLVALWMLLRPWLRAATVPGIVASVVAATLISEPPERLDPEQETMLNFADWHATDGEGRILAVNHPWFYLGADTPPGTDDAYVRLTRANLATLPEGGLVFWEGHYGHRLGGDVVPDDLDRNPRFQLLREDDATHAFHYRIYEAVGPPTSRRVSPTPR